MNPKQLEPGSSYAQYDTDGDGVVSDQEIAASERLQQLEIQNEKADAQRNMCWFALWGMLLYPSLVLVSSYLGLEKGADILGTMSSGERWTEAMIELRELKLATRSHAQRWEKLAWMVIGTVTTTVIAAWVALIFN